LQVSAQEKSAEISVEQTRPFHYLLAYGSDYRPDKSVSDLETDYFLQNYAIGLGFDKFVFILEESQRNESSGNSTLNVAYQMRDYLLWVQKRVLTTRYFAPFLTGGIGAYKEATVTKLSGISTSDESRLKLLTGVGLGIALDIPYLWFSMEARALFGDELDQQPTLSALVRIGLWF
jgi:hypothetical protein